MFDIVIIGGGILGMLSAIELHQAGQRVCVVERGQCGQESSWAGGGILSPLHPWRYSDPVSRLAAWGQQHYPTLCEQLNDVSGINPEYTRNGLLILNVDEQRQALLWAKQYQVDLAVLDKHGINTCEPQLGEVPDNALFFPAIGQVRNPRLVKALRQTLDIRGISVHEQTEVRSLIDSGKRIEGVDLGNGILRSGQVLIAAGAWSAQLPSLQNLEVRPVRGQMLVFQAPANLLKRIVLDGKRYVIPRRDGRTLIGSTLEYTGFDKQTTAIAREELCQAAYRLIPALHAYPVEKHWAGLRPGSPNGVPYIGKHPHYDNLYVNTGHFRNGVVLGTASARLVADLMLQRQPILDPADYALNAMRVSVAGVN